jgi:hypothetical protein
MRHLGKLLVLALLATTTTATADTRRPGAPGVTSAQGRPEMVEVRYRYGGQILAVDALAVGLTLAAPEPGLIVAGLGGPLVHLAHGNPGRALGSAAMRVGLVYGGGARRAATASCGNGEFLCGLGEAAVGATLGYLVAVGVDASTLAQGTRLERAPTWAPQLAASRDRVHLGLAATF